MSYGVHGALGRKRAKRIVMERGLNFLTRRGEGMYVSLKDLSDLFDAAIPVVEEQGYSPYPLRVLKSAILESAAKAM